MTCVTIDITNLDVQFHDDVTTAAEYADEHDILLVSAPGDLGELSGPQMVAIYNATADLLNANGNNLTHTKRFPNKEAGIKRIMANITDLWEDHREAQKRKPAPAKKGTAVTRRGTGVNLAPKETIYPCRAGTKQSILVDMLSREQGATMKELLEALKGGKKPWQEVTVKSGLNWDMNKIKGYGIKTTQRDGQDCYHLTYPEGMDAPLPHTLRKG